MSNKEKINKELRKFIRKNLEEYISKNDVLEESLYIEGIDIDKKNKIIKFNSKHEKNINTSVIFNPTDSEINVDGINYRVISIFRRKENEDKTDGNPLIYALKGLYGWKIDTKDITGLLKQFIRISEKIKPEYDTIISITSSSRINKEFLERLNKIIKSKYQINHFFDKIPANEVLMKHYDGKKLSFRNSSKMEDAFRKMINDKNNVFSFKDIPKNLRYTIKKSVDYDPEAYQIEYGDRINDKNILILDDTISSGTTISEYCRNILEAFTPQSVTIITLFSPL